MSSTCKSAARPRYNLPAGLIFTPRQLKQYRRWQSLHTTLRSAECGSIPTATEFDEFQQWLKRQDSGYFSDVFDDIYDHINPSTPASEPTIASLCRHHIHPVAMRQPRPRCPVCTIDMHLNYMKVLTQALHSANGRPLPCTGTPSEQQENLYLAWSQGKVSTLRQVCELEDMSAKEAEWSEKHPNDLCGDVQSATKALEIYWFEVAECQNTKQRNTKKKAIDFAEDTNFLPGRPVQYFLRNSPRYEPGTHAIQVEALEEAEDVSEDSEDYSCARVFAPGEPEGPHDHDCDAGPEESNSEHDCQRKQEDDDCDSDWEDIESDEESEESSEGSYLSFEVEKGSDFIVFSDD